MKETTGGTTGKSNRVRQTAKQCTKFATCLSPYIFIRLVKWRPVSGESAGPSQTWSLPLYSLFLEWPITDNEDFMDCRAVEDKRRLGPNIDRQHDKIPPFHYADYLSLQQNKLSYRSPRKTKTFDCKLLTLKLHP